MSRISPATVFTFNLGPITTLEETKIRNRGHIFSLQPSLKVALPLSLSNDIPLDGSLANNITLLRRQTDPEEDIEGKKPTLAKADLCAQRSFGTILPQSVARPTTVIWSMMPPSTCKRCCHLIPKTRQDNLQVGLAFPFQIDLVHQGGHKKISPGRGLINFMSIQFHES